MRRGFRLLFVVLAAVGACAPPPTFEQVATTLPPLSPEAARIFVYRDVDYQSPAWTRVFFNGANIGSVGPGYVIMRDVPPGTYDIAVASQGLYPNQDKVVVAAGGQTFYAKIETLRGLDPSADRPVPLTTYVVVIVDPDTARREVARRWYRAQERTGGALPRS